MFYSLKTISKIAKIFFPSLSFFYCLLILLKNFNLQFHLYSLFQLLKHFANIVKLTCEWLHSTPEEKKAKKFSAGRGEVIKLVNGLKQNENTKRVAKSKLKKNRRIENWKCKHNHIPPKDVSWICVDSSRPQARPKKWTPKKWQNFR